MTLAAGAGTHLIQHTVFMLTGTIKFFNKSKGFGFITADAGGKEVFLPSATVSASGLKKVEPGMRVSYSEEPDVKGPKATSLTLLDEPRRAPAPPPPPPAPRAAAVSLYFDPASRALDAVRDALAGQGIEPVAVDYTVTPPEPAELKKWALALSGSGAGLVRRSDAMFYALDLDDRFISESDFWLAVSQHPTLINGPLLKSGGKLAVCKSAEDVRRFLGLQEEPVAAVARPKGLSARLSALIRGEELPPEEDDEFEDDIAEDDIVEDEVMTEVAPPPAKAPPAAKKDAAKPVKAAAKPKPAAKAVAKKAAPARKPAAKAKKR
jgi:CspA family cold shock protein